MSLYLSAVGKKYGPVEHSWDDRDVILYALGVGAASTDPTGPDLAFTTENSEGIELRVLPTYATVLGLLATPPASELGDFEPSKLVQGEQAVSLPGSLPSKATAFTTSTIVAFYDKGSGALAVIEAQTFDASSGKLLCTSRSNLFVRGEGGFGGDRGPSAIARPTEPSPPDKVVTYATGTGQALLYRLSGDRNPLHSDPVRAKKAGFDRPILHGRCTFGFAGRAILSAVCDDDPGRLHSMQARFARPTWPGDSLTIRMWISGQELAFSVENQRGELVLDQGLATFS